MKFSKVAKVFMTAFAASYVSISSVFAAECSWLPDFLCTLVANENPVTVIEARVRAAFFIAIGAIILIAIAYGLYNAYKYIKSGGGDGMEEANKGMRSILFGIGSIFVILLGIAAVLIFFGAPFITSMLSPVCISYPLSMGCKACQTNDEATCTRCNKNPAGDCIVDAAP